MRIGEVAHSVGIGVETIRFYERKGMIEEPPRRPSGYRQYDIDAVRRLQFIRRAKELGFSLAEIKELLELRGGPNTSCADVRVQLETKLIVVQRKIEDRRHMKRALSEFARTCDTQDPSGACPILDALERTQEAAG